MNLLDSVNFLFLVCVLFCELCVRVTWSEKMDHERSLIFQQFQGRLPIQLSIVDDEWIANTGNKGAVAF